MAKRAPQDEKPFTAIDKHLAIGVMAGVDQNVTQSNTSAESATGEAQVAQPEPQVDPSPTPSSRDSNRDIAISRSKRSRSSHGGAVLEKLTREKRILMSAAEEREIERCVDRIAEAFQSPVKLSHLVRACLTVVRHAEDRIIERAGEFGPLQRPANGDTFALVEFEHQVAKALSAAFRDSTQLK